MPPSAVNPWLSALHLVSLHLQPHLTGYFETNSRHYIILSVRTQICLGYVRSSFPFPSRLEAVRLKRNLQCLCTHCSGAHHRLPRVPFLLLQSSQIQTRLPLRLCVFTPGHVLSCIERFFSQSLIQKNFAFWGLFGCTFVVLKYLLFPAFILTNFYILGFDQLKVIFVLVFFLLNQLL